MNKLTLTVLLVATCAMLLMVREAAAEYNQKPDGKPVPVDNVAGELKAPLGGFLDGLDELRVRRSAQSSGGQGPGNGGRRGPPSGGQGGQQQGGQGGSESGQGSQNNAGN